MRRWEDNVETALRETGKVTKCLEPPKGKDQLRNFNNNNKHLSSIKVGNFFIVG